jgi:hypothetical protein
MSAMNRVLDIGSGSWRALAEECRTIAETFRGPTTREQMFQLADGYDRMAEQAERQEQTEALRSSSRRHEASETLGVPPAP